MNAHKDFEFTNDVKAILDDRSTKKGRLIVVIALLIGSAITWANFAMLDEVTNGLGKVIPSSQLQVVQTLEPGTVRDIMVHEGDIVTKGQLLIRVDSTSSASKLGELNQRRWSLLGTIDRLRAEVKNTDSIDYTAELKNKASLVIASQDRLFEIRREQFNKERQILDQQLEQRKNELLELKAKQSKLTGTLKSSQKELRINRRLRRTGAVPEIEVIRLERQMTENKGELGIVRASLLKIKSSIKEATGRIESQRLKFRSEAQAEMAKARTELAVINESIKGALDRVNKAELNSPVHGVINKLNVTSIGAVVQPGKDIAVIVPLEDSLLIEARIRPQDIAFVRPQQPASVKITAYDYSIYGSLKGTVNRISADTLEDEKGNTFFRVIVKTNKNYLEKNGKKLPIMPGMVASVDIQNGQKTVLNYLLKPLIKARHQAMRER